MDASKNDHFHTLLSQLIDSIAQINTLLKHDEALFKLNSSNALSDNNEKKQIIIDKMQQQATALQACLPLSEQGKPLSFQRYVDQLDSSAARKINVLFDSLQAKLSEGYEHLVHNNQVVMGNLSFIKEFWDRLSSIAQANKDTYDNPSKSVK